ncbi:hypothetical protein BC826DRAFT_1022941 [Russula brevipes]|nr:hypothetical protein BC826DRAFT_1022941 [Russula brevipes]
MVGRRCRKHPATQLRTRAGWGLAGLCCNSPTMRLMGFWAGGVSGRGWRSGSALPYTPPAHLGARAGVGCGVAYWQEGVSGENVATEGCRKHPPHALAGGGGVRFAASTIAGTGGGTDDRHQGGGKRMCHGPRVCEQPGAVANTPYHVFTGGRGGRGCQGRCGDGRLSLHPPHAFADSGGSQVRHQHGWDRRG